MSDLWLILFRLTRYVPGYERRYAWRRNALLKFYGANITAKQNQGEWGKAEDLNHELRLELESLDQDHAEMTSTKLLNKARSMNVQIPPLNWVDKEPCDDWERSSFTGSIFLSPQGMEKVREAIRSEHRGRHERTARYLSWITAITASVAAVASVIGALK